MSVEINVADLNGLIVLYVSKDFDTATAIGPVAIRDADHVVSEEGQSLCSLCVPVPIVRAGARSWTCLLHLGS